jgi:hypothetical protein
MVYVSQNALSVFIGAFIFSIVALITAKSDIFEWIAVFYNRKRAHSKMEGQSPAAYETHTAALAA